MAPLHGVRIIDMSSVLMGPSASQTLADMGFNATVGVIVGGVVVAAVTLFQRLRGAAHPG